MDAGYENRFLNRLLFFLPDNRDTIAKTVTEDRFMGGDFCKDDGYNLFELRLKSYDSGSACR